ncbi:MAG: hypothetical protein LCH57_15145 [Proteobacteria bacterium]|nr:hypothetical protein [Pseudomonadota bacterium]
MRLPDPPALDFVLRAGPRDPGLVRELNRPMRPHDRTTFPREPQHRGRRMLTEQRDSILSA